LSTLISVYLLRRIGKKKLLVYGHLLMCIWASLIFFFQAEVNYYSEQEKSLEISSYKKEILNNFIILWIVLFIISFAFSQGSICWIYLSETMTEKGLGIATSLNWIVVVILSLGTNFTKPEETQNIFSWFFFASSGFWMLGFILIIIFIEETFGKKLEDIRFLYRNNVYDPLK